MSKAEIAALEAYPQYLDATFSGDDTSNIARRIDYKQGYEQAEKDLGWHSVDESLPEMDEEVIVLMDELGTAPIYKIGFGHIVDKNIAVDYNDWNTSGVKFWMPCPKIPRNEK